MAYEMQNWEPRLGIGLNRFTDAVSGATLELTSTPDSISQEGTPFSADRMNHMEAGIAGAAATADEAYSLNPSLIQLPSSTDLNAVITPGQYHGEGNPNSPGGSGEFYLVVETVGNSTLQTINFFLDPSATGGTYVREGQAGGTAWGSWYHVPNAASIANFYSLTADAENIPSSTSIGAVTTPGFYTGSGNTSGPEGGQFLLIVETHGTYARQTIDYSGEQYVRWGQGDGSYWLSWEKLTNDGALYVAAAGINSGWDYRRWSDGKIEFWSSANITGGAAQIEYDMAYPFTLTGAPIVWTQGVDNCWDLSRPIYVEPSIYKNIKIYLYPRSTDSRTYRVNVYAVGNMA